MSQVNHNELDPSLLHWIQDHWGANDFGRVLQKLGRCGITTLRGLQLAVEHKTVNTILHAVGEKGFKQKTLDEILNLELD